MSTAKEIWETLSKINVNDHTDKKNNFTYLSWTWAWATLQENYPNSTYHFKPDLWHNGTCEVWVDLTVEDITRTMWLAVTDYKNKAVVNPSCDLIANARMRCLVKAIAMFGLGHYIYAGESLPMENTKPVEVVDEHAERQKALNEAVNKHSVALEAIKDYLATDEYSLAYEAWSEIPDDDKKALWVAPTKFENAPFSTAERDKMKSNEMTEARKAFHGETN